MSLTDTIAEARRQVEICNACRYCEGYCDVFPAIHRQRAFSEGDITQYANLCHNCRGCYYACQFTEPHEFAINIPKALAEVRHESWQRLAGPAPLARWVQQHFSATILITVIAFAVTLFWIMLAPQNGGNGFYATLSHAAMVALFLPAFLLPVVMIGVSMRDYWTMVAAGPLTIADIRHALGRAANMRNLSGGHGEGCNFEDEDRFSSARRHAHQATMWGFLLSFASTSVATLMHYLLGMEAPYGLFSLPKLLGIPGGVLLCVGTAGLWMLKRKADPSLGAEDAEGGNNAFVALLFFVSFTGLALYALTGTSFVPAMLAIHLACVLTFFLLMPFSKMVHGFFRMAALLADAQKRG